MPKVVFFNSVHTDGKGDFEHLMTIIAPLKKISALQNFQFYAVVNCTLWPKEDFEKQLQDLNIDGYFLGRLNDSLWENTELQKHLAEAVQIIQISRAQFNWDNYTRFINPNAIFKFIGEHEDGALMLFKIIIQGVQKKFITRSMGLSPGKFGIKLQDRKSQITQDPFTILQSHDPQFCNVLLAHTQSPNIDYFKHTHYFVPAYYSNMGPFCKLLLLFIINNKLPQDHNIAIFLSGMSNLLKSDLQELSSDKIYKDIVSTVRQVVLIQAQGDPITVYPLNPTGTRSIQVFAGFRLSDAGFDAAFNAASFIAGVSGDNTFERTVSTKLLPFYWSTNENLKKKTVVALANIVQERLNAMNVAEEIKRDLLTFFNYDKFSRFINFFRDKEEELAALYEFRNLDLIAMAKVWSEIAQYIIEHHNFYDRLLNIFSEGLDPALFLTNTSVVPAAASATGTYGYPQISQWHQKLEDVSTSGDKLIPPEAQSPSSLKNK